MTWVIEPGHKIGKYAGILSKFLGDHPITVILDTNGPAQD